MKLTDAVADFFTDSAAKGNSAYTLTYYECILKRFANFTGDIEVSTITVSLCKQYYFHLSDDGLTSGSVQTYIRGLRAFLH